MPPAPRDAFPPGWPGQDPMDLAICFRAPRASCRSVRTDTYRQPDCAAISSSAPVFEDPDERDHACCRVGGGGLRLGGGPFQVRDVSGGIWLGQ